MVGGSAIEVFTDFVLSTGPAFLRGPEDIVNDAVKNTYTLPRFIYGKSMKDMIQGGNSIKDNILLGSDSNAQNYKPNAEFNYRNPQVLSQWSIPWRFTKDEMVWTDHEIGLNTGEMSRGARHHKFKTLKYSKEQNLYTGLMDFIDDQFWAPGDQAEMEATDGATPYSIPVFINEETDTVPQGGGTWTTIMGIDPTVKTGWQNQTQAYDVVGLASAATTAQTHLFKAMSRLYYRVRFDKLPVRGDLSEKVSVPQFISTSLRGISNLEDSARMNQDTFVAGNRRDADFSGSMFRSVEVVYISDLDSAAIYPTGLGGILSDENDTANTVANGNEGPRYFFCNGKYMLKVIHRDRYFYKRKPFSPSKQPYTHIMIVDIWHNNVCRSRRRQGILNPSTDILL